MLVIRPDKYRIHNEGPELTDVCGPITPENLVIMMEARAIEVNMDNGRWWRIRKTGRRQTWVTRPGHFRVPYKAGMYVNGAITHEDFIKQDVYEIASRKLGTKGETVVLTTDGNGWTVSEYHSDVEEKSSLYFDYPEALEAYKNWS